MFDRDAHEQNRRSWNAAKRATKSVGSAAMGSASVTRGSSPSVYVRAIGGRSSGGIVKVGCIGWSSGRVASSVGRNWRMTVASVSYSMRFALPKRISLPTANASRSVHRSG